MKTPLNAVTNVVEVLMRTDAVRATKYLTPTHIVRGTKKRYSHTGTGPRGNFEVILTIGKPNYAEREFIRACRKTNEPFPVKKVQLRFPVKEKSGLKPRSKTKNA